MKMSIWFCVVCLSAALRLQAAEIAWQTDFETLSGWYDNKTNSGFMAKIDQPESSVLRVTQQGQDSWGKVAVVVENVDLNKTAILQTKVNKVDENSAIKVCVASLDWSEFYEVIPRTSADGVHTGDIKKATGWNGTKSFNVVLVVEGKEKAAWFKHIQIGSKS